MELNKLNEQYRLITEDNLSIEDKIDYFKILRDYSSDEKKSEFQTIIDELEQLLTFNGKKEQ